MDPDGPHNRGGLSVPFHPASYGGAVPVLFMGWFVANHALEQTVCSGYVSYK